MELEEISGGDTGHRLENEMPEEVVPRTGAHFIHRNQQKAVKTNRTVSPPQELREIRNVCFAYDLNHLSVAVIKYSEENNLEEKGFSWIYSSQGIHSSRVEQVNGHIASTC